TRSTAPSPPSTGRACTPPTAARATARPRRTPRTARTSAGPSPATRPRPSSAPLPARRLDERAQLGELGVRQLLARRPEEPRHRLERRPLEERVDELPDRLRPRPLPRHR